MSNTSRILSELRKAPSMRESDAAIARLRAREVPLDAYLAGLVGPDARGPVLEIAEGGDGVPIDALRVGAWDIVRLGQDVYPSVPRSEARAHLAGLLKVAARRFVVMHVPLDADRSHVGRAIIDAPRRVLRKLGVDAPEPGDRFAGSGYRHRFFDEEPLAAELARAGLAIRRRRGFTFLLVRLSLRDAERPEPFATELVRVLRIVRACEAARTREPPEFVLRRMRARGAGQRQRGAIGRARLERAISWVDALAKGGPNCYRRTLLELALDAGAAREPVVFGLDVGRTGHVAFKDREDRVFDVHFEVGP